MAVDGKSISFYENDGRVDIVTTVDEGKQYLVLVTMSGEGEISRKKILLSLASPGITVLIMDIDEDTSVSANAGHQTPMVLCKR